MARITAFIPAGSVEYGMAEASVDINELIRQLENARDNEGATHVAGLSGNYRGAQYVRLGEVTVDEDSFEGEQDEDWNSFEGEQDEDW